MANFVVTGGCGFIGSHLVEALLAKGHGVRIIDDLSTGKRENVPTQAQVVVGDVADADLVASTMAGADGCFHLAAIASVQRGNEEWLETHKANLTGTIAVLDAARGARDGGPVPVVYASSAAVYGDCDRLPLNEQAPTHPLSAYGADKLGSELHASVASGVHGVPTTGFRFFNIYGPRQDPNSPYSGVIAIFAQRLARGEGVTVFGDGGQYRDFVYVADVVRYLQAAMTDMPAAARVFNICTGRTTTVVQLARSIAEIAGVKADISYGPARIGDIRESVGDPAAVQAAFGFGADTVLMDGLRETLKDYL